MPPNMRKTPHGYTYLRAVPSELREVVKKTVFKKALGRNYKVAKDQVAQLEVESNRVIAEARAMLANSQALDSYLKCGPESRLKSIAITPELSGQLAALWLSGLDNDLSAREEGLDDEEFQSLDENVAEILPQINRALATGKVARFVPAVTQLLHFRGYDLKATEAEVQKLTYTVLRHMQTGYKTLSARQQGEQVVPLDLSVLPEPFAPAWEPAIDKKTVKTPRLSDVAPLYQNHLASDDRKTQTTNLSIWQRLVTFCKDKPIEAVQSDDIYHFLESRLKDSTAPWSQRYLLRAKNVLRQAFALAKTHNLISHNPVSQLEILPKISKEIDDKRYKPRFPYSEVQLNILFASEWYSPDADNWRGKMRTDLGARYWVPLICLFHGLRIREVLQLCTPDVVLDEGTVPLIRIQAESDGDSTGPARRLKNDATRRTVPIHPTLLDLGFLEFVGDAKKHRESRPLFLSSLPELDSKHPLWGRAYEQRYVPFVRDTLGFGPGYGNHSFRHTLEDRIRDIQLESVWPPGLSQFYTGRKVTRSADKDVLRTEGSEALYGSGYNPSRIRPYVEKISFPGVRLPPPFRVWLGDRETESAALRQGLERWTAHTKRRV